MGSNPQIQWNGLEPQPSKIVTLTVTDYMDFDLKTDYESAALPTELQRRLWLKSHSDIGVR